MDLIRHVRMGFSLLILVSSASAFGHDGAKLSPAAVADCENRLEHLVIGDLHNRNAYSGMTDEATHRLILAQAQLKNVTQGFEANFEGMRGILEMELLTMAT